MNTPKRVEFAPMLGPAEEYPEGSVEWAERISNRLRLATESLTRDTVQRLKSCLVQIWKSELKPWDVWPKDDPFKTPDDYCKAVTGHSWDTLLTMVNEMGRNGDQLELTEHQMRADLAKAEVKHKPQGKHHRAMSTMKRGSTNASYLLRRIARENPDIFKAYENGEFRSVRAAAIAAGIIKDRSVFERVVKLLPRLTEDERLQLKAML